MNPGPQTPRTNHFGGLFGVFSDSLPDAWGRLILDRYLGHRNIDPTSLNILAKLSVGGPASFGGLSYRPSQMPHEEKQIDDFDALNEDFRKIIIGEEVEDWDSLYCAAGSSGGSRPKAYIRLDGEDWIIKFPHRNDPSDIGKMEYDYMKAAEECGILIPEVRLLETPKGNKFFAIKRFDREGNRRFHVVSSSSLLERDFSNPTMDYEDLLKLVTIMSKGDKEQIKRMYLLMCFNVFGKNQDDHGKNFSFIYDDVKKKWSLSPAYDLTFSPTIFGEQTMTVSGKGKDISIEDLASLGASFLSSKKECRLLAETVKNIVSTRLGQYLNVK